MKRKTLIAHLFFLLIMPLCPAQNEWSLEDCINYALDNNIQIKRQELAADLSEYEYMQSKLEMLPNLNAGLIHTFSSGRALNTETYEWQNRDNQDGSFGVASNLTLFNGLKNYNNIQKRKYDLLNNLAMVEKLKNDITIILASSYLQILFDEELLDVAKSQLEVTELQVERMKKMVEVGNSAKGELLDMVAQKAIENLKVINAENQLEISILNLTQLLDLDSVGDFKILKPQNLEIVDIPLPEVDSFYNTAISNLPQIKGARYNVSSAEKSLAIAKGDRYPNLFLRSEYYTRYNKASINPLDADPTHPTMDYPYPDQINDNQYRSASLNLYVPIFNKKEISTKINHAKIALNDSKYKLEQAQQVLYKEIQLARADAKAALEKYHSATDAVKSSEEAFNYAEHKFNIGVVTSIEFNEAKNNLTRARSELLKAKYEYIFKTKILDFYRGVPITL
ncbi:MAG: TolC family protein [Bacteroidales bacterium]|nr:MAG: TolC family protein [Bacteroidales bacterium]